MKNCPGTRQDNFPDLGEGSMAGQQPRPVTHWKALGNHPGQSKKDRPSSIRTRSHSHIKCSLSLAHCTASHQRCWTAWCVGCQSTWGPASRKEKCDDFINHETINRTFFGFLLLLEDKRAINLEKPCKQAKQNQTIHSTIGIAIVNCWKKITYLVGCLLRYIMPYILLKYT